MQTEQTLEQIIREELETASRFGQLLAQRGLTYKLVPLTKNPPGNGKPHSAGADQPPSGENGSPHPKSADRGSNKQKVVDAINAHVGDAFNVHHISKATGLPVTAVSQVFRRLPQCADDYVLEEGKGRRATLYIKKPHTNSDSDLIERAAADLALLSRPRNGHHAHPEGTSP